MKKIIIFFLIIFLVCGCYDYTELNDISIVSGISIDYEDEIYNVGFEVLNGQRESKDSSKTSAYTVMGSGISVSEAFNNASKKIAKRSYFSHLKVLIISENLADQQFNNIIDFFLRTPNVRNEFYPVISYQMSAFDMLNSSSFENPVVSEQIESLLKSNKYYSNNATTLSFEDILKKILSFGEDATMSVLLKKDEKLIIYGLGLFKDYKLKGLITDDDAMTYNVLINNTKSAYYTFACSDNEYITFTIYDSNTDISFANNKILIKASILANIEEMNCKYDLNLPTTYNSLNAEYGQKFEDIIGKFITRIKDYDSDILGISNKYYLKKRIKNPDVWKNMKTDIEVDFIINKKGLIFEVEDDN